MLLAALKTTLTDDGDLGRSLAESYTGLEARKMHLGPTQGASRSF
jgi:hypothetical protein